MTTDALSSDIVFLLNHHDRVYLINDAPASCLASTEEPLHYESRPVRPPRPPYGVVERHNAVWHYEW